MNTYVVLIIVLFFIFYHYMAKKEAIKNEAERKKGVERKAKEAEEHYQKKKESHRKIMINIVTVLNNQVTSIKELYEEILDSIVIAEDALNTARNEYNGGYYAPFWDQIEVATNQLASCNNYLYKINSYVDKY